MSSLLNGDDKNASDFLRGLKNKVWKLLLLSQGLTILAIIIVILAVIISPAVLAL